MFINIRYLVITVISIFLALGIGILIGIQMDSQDIIIEQQAITVERMEKRVEEFNRTNTILQKELEHLNTVKEMNNSYMKNVFPDYIKNKLSGLQVAIIETSEDYAFNNMRQALRISGAQVVSFTINSEKLTNLSENEKNAIKEYFNIKENNIIPAILKKTADTIAGKNNVQDLEYLKEIGLIYIKGEIQNPADCVVMAGGSKENNAKPELIDIPLIREIKKYSIPVVGVELSDSKISYIDHYKKEKLSTVDNVDSIIGQTSLILVLSGKEGNYGVKKTASALMPFLSEEEQPK